MPQQGLPTYTYLPNPEYQSTLPLNPPGLGIGIGTSGTQPHAAHDLQPPQ